MSAAREVGRRPLTYLRAALAAVGTAVWLARLERGNAFDQTVARLRAGRAFPRRLADPAVHARVVNRLLPWLPPRGMGRCLKRSLLLLHLWSRCGLAPTLHLGFVGPVHGSVQGHAWLTASSDRGPVTAGVDAGYTEAFVF